MKELKTPMMQNLLKKGLRKAQKMHPPSDGSMFSLFTHELRNGWYYQVDYVNDSRFYEKPMVTVCGFRPPRVHWAKSAEYCLKKAVALK